MKGEKGLGVGWVVTKAETKKQGNTNSRFRVAVVYTMYTQYADNPLQGLDRDVY